MVNHMSVQRRWSHETDLALHKGSASHARAFVALHLRAHDLATMADDLQLVVSELVTNAMLHAQPPYTVSLRAFETTLRLEMLDGANAEPSMMVAGPLDTYGRGVMIVQALSRDWGVLTRTSGGKTVWADFDIPRTYTPAL
jgi:anti-sigma regulatory factor (Ser/Thr protein kinase)